MQYSKENKNNPMHEVRRKSNRDWFLYWLYEDDEFQKENNSLTAWADELYSLSNNTETDDKVDKRIADFCLKWEISEDDYNIINGPAPHTIYPTLDFPFKLVDNKINGDIVLRIPHNIKRNEYLEAWESVRSLLNSNKSRPLKFSSRLRSADDTRLIYAIHKARKKKLTFAQIFSLYQKGNLDQYSNQPTNQFSSEDSLERYFNKYKPDR